jgi:hypothetical protein
MHLIRSALLTLACAALTAPAAASAATVPTTGANSAATITRIVIYKGGGDDTPVGPPGPLKMASQAASASTNPKVGETVLKNGTWHKYEAKYWNLPGRIALMEPSNREVSGLQWFSWTRAGGIANGVERQAGGCCGAAVVVTVTRPRNGHFTRMTVKASGAPQKLWWPAVVKRNTLREWQQSNDG